MKVSFFIHIFRGIAPAIFMSIALLFCAHTYAYGNATFEPGFKTVGIYVASSGQRLDVNIWYPSPSRPSPTSYSPWLLDVVPYGRAVKGRFPTLVISHDTVATRFSYHETAALLAKSGFVVLMPQHPHDNQGSMPHIFTVEQLTRRVEDIRLTLDTALEHADIKDSIDPMRIGVVGFGTGGTAALLMGGATLDPTGWKHYCDQVPLSSAYCNSWGRGRMQKMASQLPLKQSIADPRVKAVAAISPNYPMFFSAQAMQDFSLPLLLMEAENDSLNRTPWNVARLMEHVPGELHFRSIENVDVHDLMSPCPPELQRDIPDLCGTANTDVRLSAHTELNISLQRFFLDTIGSVSTK